MWFTLFTYYPYEYRLYPLGYSFRHTKSIAKENSPSGEEQRPYEVIGFTEEERLRWRVNQERFEETLNGK
jgi:hypothetical protein